VGHSVRGGGTRRRSGAWPLGMGFEYFYGFMGGETAARMTARATDSDLNHERAVPMIEILSGLPAHTVGFRLGATVIVA
jgi:hypothetical protein